ncbi:MAG: family 78 glycoside hydrolase catalytic domain, partial [Chlorobia bacterium]|nr:family 78 glycoside hydrolase catalytic domain [Fimbriimonadaceae bacterium]
MLSALFLAVVAAPGTLLPTHMRCEAVVNPVGVGTAAPRLSWKLAPARPNLYNLRQTGYRVTVGSKPHTFDLWDSGKVSSDETINVRYSGKPLASGQKVWWRVQVFDQRGSASPWSNPATWSVGLLRPEDWKGRWIGFDAPAQIKANADPYAGAKWIWGSAGRNSVYFQRTLTVRPGLTKATMRMTADDQFSLIVNGKQIAASDGNTDAWRRPVVVALTKALTSGENTIHVRATNAGGEAALVGSLELVYGATSQRLLTDEFWEAADSESSPFARARIVREYGAGPWGKLGQQALLLPPARMLRKEFNLAQPIKRATLYGTALGLLELRLNGKQISDELFTPGWTDYAKRVYVRGYDVTKNLRRGQNAVGALIGDGWYAGYVGFGNQRHHYGSKIRANVQLDIEFLDGSKTTVASDPTWQASTGPILESDFLMGEQYDARLEKSGWDMPNYKGTGWQAVSIGSEMNPKIEPFNGQPVRPYATLRAKTIKQTGDDTYVLDLGQNLAGFARLRATGKAGQKITLRFAERLNPDGTIYVTNLRAARCIDTYTFKGGATETWEPRFTFHGFQYIEVKGLGRKPTVDEVVGVAISSDTPDTGKIITSDPMINKLVSNAWWTQRMNFIDIPTDCPQRDERLGWTGDAQAYVRTASMLTDVQPFFTKWLITLDDAQRADGQFPTVAPLKVSSDDGGPAWADAGVICPWEIYNVYGDKELLARHYPQMKKFIEFMVKRSTPDLLPPPSFHCFGDWLNINANTPPVVIYTAYFAGSTRIVADAARALGKDEEARKYDALYNRVRATFLKNYVAVDGVVAGNTQCAYILALAFDLIPEENGLRQKAANLLVADIEKRGWHLSTG